MKINQWSIYLVNLGSKQGTKPGKTRPCLCIQPNHFSALPSTVILPFTSKLVSEIEDFQPLRIRVNAGIAGLEKTSDLLIDQMIAWDNENFVEEIGFLPEALQINVKEALKEFLDLS